MLTEYIAFAFMVGALLPLSTDSIAKVGMKLRPIEMDQKISTMAETVGVKLDRVYLKEGGGINAYSLGGLKNVLILERESMNLPEEEFKAMVAHELSHIKRRHSLMRGAVLASGLLMALWLSSLNRLFLPAFLLVFLVDMLICRRMESQADRDAATFADPKALISLIWRYGDTGSMSDHPSAQTRVKKIESMISGH